MTPAETDEGLDGCGSAFVTAAMVVDATIEQVLRLRVPTIFHGVTIVDAAKVRGLRRFCDRRR